MKNDFMAMALMFMAAYMLWDLFVLYPLRLLVTLFHEAGHAVAAKATGGRVMGIVVRPDSAGITATEGGSGFLILNAGYLGSLAFGALFFGLTYTHFGRYSLIVLCVLVEAITLLWVKDNFGLIFNTCLCLLLTAAGFFFIGEAQAVITRFISVCCVMFALIDINSYSTHVRLCRKEGVHKSDAVLLGEMTRVPAFAWVKFWQLLSLGVLLLLLKIAGAW